jgi:hypothetical protein
MLIRYQNTDLDLVSSDDLIPLAAAFEAGGLRPLHVTRGEDGLWYTTLETREQYTNPESNIAAMLTVVESLGEPFSLGWRACTKRECNIGYACGREPWAFSHELPTQLLRRIVDVGASLRITLYPLSDQDGEP